MVAPQKNSEFPHPLRGRLDRPAAPSVIADYVLDRQDVPRDDVPEPVKRYSYTALKMGAPARLRELASLVRVALRSQATAARDAVGTVRRAQRMIFEATGKHVENARILEIGPGQELRHLRCFALENEVTGIDTDAIVQRFDVAQVARLFRKSPWMRAAKTLGRAALRKDARFKSALARELGVGSFPELRVLQMDATQMAFPEGSFDLAFSCSVFEHISDPHAALREVVRVLRPGGVAYVSVHLYTSHSGQHDPRIFAQGRPVAPLWPHLRPELAHTVHSSAHLNRLTLRQWRDLFDSVMPGVHFAYDRDEDDLRGALAQLREQGELVGLTDEELLTVNVIALWQKPPSDRAS
jgi:SAM-dependent methyltransferase